MDVLCVGMYRACSTWQYEVAAHLVERHREGRRLGFVTGEEYAGREAKIPRASGWRILKAHEGHRRYAAALTDRRAVAIYAHRDLRDVVFSLMHKRALSFEDLVRRGMLHQIRANDRFWSRQDGLLVQRYEDLIADPAKGIEGLAAHLGITLGDGEAAALAEEYSFEKNRRRVRDLGRRLAETCGDLGDPGLAQVYDERTLLHWNHIRDGKVGGWRAEATPRQRETLARLCGDWLVKYGYEPDDSWRGESWTEKPLQRARLKAAIARGGLVCRLRGLSTDYPRTASITKRVFRIKNEPLAARSASEVARGERPHGSAETWEVPAAGQPGKSAGVALRPSLG